MGLGFRVGVWVTDLDVHAAAKGEHHALVRVRVGVEASCPGKGLGLG